MTCNHQPWEREASIETGGYCPICLAAENALFRAALREISQPLVTMQDRAKAEGYQFNGETALNIISNPEHYRLIARRALGQDAHGRS